LEFWPTTFDETSEPSPLTSENSPDNEPDLVKLQRNLIREKIGDCLRIGDSAGFSQRTPPSVAQSLQEEHFSIIHRIAHDVFSQDDGIPQFPEVKGNLINSQICFFSPLLQLLKAIPNITDYIALHIEIPNVLQNDLVSKKAIKNFNDFLDMTPTALFDMENAKHVYAPKAFKPFKYFLKSSSCYLI
jgi:hypothetical protein